MSFFKSKYFIIFFLIANIYFILSNIPLIILTLRTPPDTVFPLYQPNHFADYTGYLSAITQGQTGSWYFRNPYTSEAPIPSIFYLYYILIGKITAPFQLWPPFAYHLARIVTVEFFIISVFFLANTLLRPDIAVWVSVFSIIGTIPPPFIFNQKEAFITLNPWWSKFDAILRLNGIPHHIFGQACLLTSLALFFQYLKTSVRKHIRFSYLSAFIGGLVYAPSMLIGFFSLSLSFFIYSLRESLFKKRLSFDKKLLIKLIPLLFTICITLLISWLQTNIGYHKAVWVDWEIDRWNLHEPLFNIHLFYLFSVLIILTFPIIIIIAKEGSWNKFFIMVWAISPLLLLPIIQPLSLSKIRLLSGTPFVPYGFLFAHVILFLRKKYKQKITRYVYILFSLITMLSTSLNFLFLSTKSSIEQPLYTNHYYSQNIQKVLNFINKNIPKNSIILSNEYMGNIIPAFTPTISYFGHINLTYNFNEKQYNVWKFYTNKMDSDEALSFITNNGIEYIYFGEYEKSLNNRTLKYSFISPIFTEKNITIFRFLRPISSYRISKLN